MDRESTILINRPDPSEYPERFAAEINLAYYNDLINGVFTYSILEAMMQYETIKISELKKIVGVRVFQLTNGMQKPTSRNETISVDWSLW